MINLNNSTKYYIFLNLHLFICLCLVYGWLIPNKMWLEFLIMASIFIQIMYGMFKGCICTRLERKYDKLKRTNSIISPIINIIGIKNDKTNIDFITGLFVNLGLICTIIVRYIFLDFKK